MYLYRVEHRKTKEGPYAHYGPMQDVRPHLYKMDDHPNPWDEDLAFEFGMHCGFESKDKLMDWFTMQDLKDFEEEDLHVYKIHTDTDSVQCGERQLIFDPETNYYRKKIPLKDLREYSRVCLFYGEDNGRLSPFLSTEDCSSSQSC